MPVWPVSGCADRLAGGRVPYPHRVVPLPEAMRLPSGLNATLITSSVWPVSGAPIGWPVAASHSRTVLSPLPEAMRVPVGAERHTGHRAGVAGQRRADRLAGGGVPQPHRLVVAAGDDARARRG